MISISDRDKICKNIALYQVIYSVFQVAGLSLAFFLIGWEVFLILFLLTWSSNVRSKYEALRAVDFVAKHQ